MIGRRKPALFVLRSRPPSEPEVWDFFERAEMSSHAILVFLSLEPAEQGRRWSEWQASTLDREIQEMGETVAEVVSEEAYRALPWRCLWNREVEFFD